MVKLEFFNHYSAPISFLQSSLHPSLKKAVKALMSQGLVLKGAPLLSLDYIEMNLVDDATITEVHGSFMDDPTPTDVITFHHGEVFVSYDTALRESETRGITLAEELFRYHLHGILHLAGYEDLTPEDYKVMHTLQEHLISLHSAF